MHVSTHISCYITKALKLFCHGSCDLTAPVRHHKCSLDQFPKNFIWKNIGIAILLMDSLRKVAYIEINSQMSEGDVTPPILSRSLGMFRGA